jgi:hypothetical protein
MLMGYVLGSTKMTRMQLTHMQAPVCTASDSFSPRKKGPGLKSARLMTLNSMGVAYEMYSPMVVMDVTAAYAVWL